MNERVRKLTEPYDQLRGLECDGMTRVLHTVLDHHRIPHRVMGGSVSWDGQEFNPHFWIELSGGWVVDYRLRMWFGSKAPHGIFKPDQVGVDYQGHSAGFPVLREPLFTILTEGLGMAE